MQCSSSPSGAASAAGLRRRSPGQVRDFHDTSAAASILKIARNSICLLWWPIPGLYFVGVAAANSFGPLLRFALGAGFCSSQRASHLVRGSSAMIAALSSCVKRVAPPRLR
jgi:hypothetical protein